MSLFPIHHKQDEDAQNVAAHQFSSFNAAAFQPVHAQENQDDKGTVTYHSLDNTLSVVIMTIF